MNKTTFIFATVISFFHTYLVAEYAASQRVSVQTGSVRTLYGRKQNGRCLTTKSNVVNILPKPFGVAFGVGVKTIKALRMG